MGPISLRVFATLSMIGYLLLHINEVRKKANNSYIKTYILYIILLGIALVFNGDFTSYGYVKQVLAFFLVAIVAYYATVYFIKTYKDITPIYVTLIAILILTSVVTILQFNGNPIGWQLGLWFKDLHAGLEEKIYNYEARQDNLLGASYAVGIFGHPVSNAMFIASIAILPIFQVIHNKSLIKRIVYLVIFAIGLIACFMTQQRSAFFMLLVVSILSLVYFSRHKFVILLIGVLLVVLAWPTVQQLMVSDQLGRLSVANLQTDETRQMLWSNAELFILDNFLWGGPMTFIRLNEGLPPHNFFFSAFIYGGMFGGITLIYLFFKMCKDTILIVLKKSKTENYAVIFSVSLFLFLIQGLFHSGTLVDGEALIFVLLAVAITANKFKEQKQ